MEHPETRIVTQDDVRPITQMKGETTCTYCGQQVGDEHKSDCVCRERTIVACYEFKVVLRIPEFWPIDLFEDHRNILSWCADNALDEIENFKGDCLCPIFKAEYLREATQDDEDFWNGIDG